jgi:hypothetical protein
MLGLEGLRWRLTLVHRRHALAEKQKDFLSKVSSVGAIGFALAYVPGAFSAMR